MHRTQPQGTRASWIRPVVLLGIGYALVGILFARPATHVHAWRFAAWTVSGVGYAVHIGYEHFRLRNAPGLAALHVALAAALGAFGLAVGANIHSWSAGTINRLSLLRLSLAVWPLITAIPAFVIALAANLGLGRALSRADRT